MLIKNLTRKMVPLVAIFLVLVTPLITFAQQSIPVERGKAAPNLFSLSPKQLDALSSDQTTQIDRYAAAATTAEMAVVAADAALLASGEPVNLNLFADAQTALTPHLIETRSEQDFSWFAQDQATNTHAVLVINGNTLFGNVRINGALFQVRPLGDGLTAVIRADESAFPPDHPEDYAATIMAIDEAHVHEVDDIVSKNDEPAEVDEAQIDNGDSVSEADIAAALLPEAGFPTANDAQEELGTAVDDTPQLDGESVDMDTTEDNTESPAPLAPQDQSTTITVIVAYTNQARLEVGGTAAMNTLIQTAVDETNQTYRNSHINTRLHLVHRYQIAYSESNSMSTDLDRFRTNGDGIMDNIHTQRDAHDADVAILIRTDTTSCGIARLNAVASTAFGVVAQDCATGVYSFGHEIGHIQGAHHNSQIATNSYFPYGHGYYYQPGNWRTVMAYNCPAGCTRLPYWSNPNVYWNGVPMGTASTHNNARVLNETAAKVSAFRTTGIAGVVETGDQFGRALAEGDFNGDGFVDLAIGVPYEDIVGSGWFPPTYNNAGMVNVLYSTAGGLSTVDNQGWHQDSTNIDGGAESGDRFGYALATGDFNNDGYDDLAIGVPYESINNQAGAGAVNVIYGSAAGLTSVGDQLWHQDTAGVLGGVEAGDHFGMALSSGDFNNDGFDDLAIGVPDEGLSGRANVGAVNVLFGSWSKLTAVNDQFWHQDSAGILGGTETNDRFGASLAAGDFDGDAFDDLAIGVPTESINNIPNAGAVNVIYGSFNRLTANGDQFWHQDSTGILGGAESGDQFGFSLAAGDFNGNSLYDDLAIGVPYESIGFTSNAGAVNVIYGNWGSGLTANGDQFWHQDSNFVEGVVEAGDQFGYSLAAGNIGHFSRDALIIGVPYEALGTLQRSGVVQVLYSYAGSGLTANGDQMWHQDSPGIAGGAEAEDRFGFAVASGDFNNDNRSDLAAGVPIESIGGKLNAGAVNAIYSNGNTVLSAQNDHLWHQDS